MIHSTHVTTVTVLDPDSSLPVEIEIRKLETGAMVGLDGSWLVAHDENPNSPYDDDKIVVPGNETGFVERFKDHVCVGDSIECEQEGFTITATIRHDEDYHIENDDIHNKDQSAMGLSDEDYEKSMRARRAWYNEEWFYCGIVLSVAKNGVMLDPHAESLWGIECNYPGSDNKYLTEVANDLLNAALKVGQEIIEKLTL